MSNELLVIEDPNIKLMLLTGKGIFLNVKSFNDLIEDMRMHGVYEDRLASGMTFTSFIPDNIINDLIRRGINDHVVKLPMVTGNSPYFKEKVRLNQRKVIELEDYAKELELFKFDYEKVNKYIMIRIEFSIVDLAKVDQLTTEEIDKLIEAYNKNFRVSFKLGM